MQVTQTMLLNIDDQADKLLKIMLANEEEIRHHRAVVNRALLKIAQLEQANLQIQKEHDAIHQRYMKLFHLVKA